MFLTRMLLAGALALPPLASAGADAQETAGTPQAPAAAAPASRAPGPWLLSQKAQYFFGSHTSFEFGNPFPPGQKPLSRLEFPLDSWWAGLSLSREFTRFSVRVEGLACLSDSAAGRMADSDWDDDENPEMKTLYSKSRCRMGPGGIVRGEVGLRLPDWIRLPRWVDLRPCFGVTWQHLALIAHDGIQYYLPRSDDSPPEVLPGDSLRFKQTYWMFSGGLKAAFDLGHPPGLTDLQLLAQADWAYVEACNRDHHLLREGRRMTYEDTTGGAWHAMVDLKAGLWNNISAHLTLEYLHIDTTGTHRLVNELYEIDFKFRNGVRVWSEQISAAFSLECKL